MSSRPGFPLEEGPPIVERVFHLIQLVKQRVTALRTTSEVHGGLQFWKELNLAFDPEHLRSASFDVMFVTLSTKKKHATQGLKK